MSNAKSIDVSKIRFSSTVFPTEEDMALWDSLSAEEQRAVVQRDLDEAEASGIADQETMPEIIARVRSNALIRG